MHRIHTSMSGHAQKQVVAHWMLSRTETKDSQPTARARLGGHDTKKNRSLPNVVHHVMCNNVSCNVGKNKRSLPNAAHYVMCNDVSCNVSTNTLPKHTMVQLLPAPPSSSQLLLAPSSHLEEPKRNPPC